jgi:hypothetical protein
MAEEYKSITGLVDGLPETPQFLKAEYLKERPAQICGQCGRPIGIRSYVVDSKLVCDRCEAQAHPASHSGFVRGMVFGAGAAIVGLALYATFTITTHFYFGYVAFGVGWLVAKAMMTGSRGVGGKQYQIAAVLLTYAAISLASVPILIAAAVQDAADRGIQTHVDWASIAGKLVAWGIASPFLQLREGVGGVIGLVILLAGLRIAYRMTADRARQYS